MFTVKFILHKLDHKKNSKTFKNIWDTVLNGRKRKERKKRAIPSSCHPEGDAAATDGSLINLNPPLSGSVLGRGIPR